MNSFQCIAASSVAGLLLFAGPAVFAADGSKSIDFRRDIQPIFAARCVECHGAAEPEGGFRLTARTEVLKRNDSGQPAIVSGKSGASELIRRVSSQDETERMPPEGKPLSTEQIALLKAWIDAGAEWPADGDASKHWAYVNPVRPDVPKTEKRDWAVNAVDHFILARLAKENLEPSPPVDPARLLRRVSLDLIGLPPSVEEVDAFLNDRRPDAYERVVNRLLDSPRYGERWARQWLDLARYADSNGYQADQFRSIWAYRDWVIDAFNDDMPFDEFTIAQLAGDLLPDAALADRIATGFHRCTTCNVEAGVDPEENRVNQLVDRVNTTGTVWLGTTLECAQCHNHKYDPFTMQDYYQLFAFFNNTPLEVVQPNGQGVQFEVAGPTMPLPLSDELAQKKAELEQRQGDIEANIAERSKVLESSQAEWEQQVLAASQSAPEWHVLEVTSFQSTGGADHKVQDDKSVLLVGDKPAKDTYIIEAETNLTGVTGFKLETLTDPSLPGNGPGRGDAQRPNFVLYEFEVTAQSLGGEEAKPQAVTLSSAAADFSQKNWDVGGLIDGDAKTGWGINPQFGKPHWATFVTAEPAGFEQGTRFTFRLPQEYGGARTIGRLRLSAMTGDPGGKAVPDNVRKILAITAEKRNKQQATQLRSFYEQQDPQMAKLRSSLADVQKSLKAVQPDTTLVMVELDKPRMTHIFKRGDFLQPGVEVAAATPSVLHPLQTEGERNRLTLARWLVSTENPLVARVTVNRWWAEFFGRGIVETLEDFGTQGEVPTHPDLLDWLAVEFMQSGWSMKHVHKLIVMSATYRQASTVTPHLLNRDPLNKLYARGPRFRLSAETVRDNALAVSGLLSTKMHGPPIYPPQPPGIWRHVGRNEPKYNTSTGEDRFRRGLYVVWRRSAPYPSFVNFDATDRASCVVQRSRTNTPLQALTLLNDPAYVEMAVALAKRLATARPEGDVRDRIDYGLRLCVSRSTSADEVEHLWSVFEEARERFANDAKAAETLIPAKDRLKDVDLAELAAWFYVANILLNLDETITKG